VVIIVSNFIETVYLSPMSPRWLYDLVTSISARYGLNVEIRMSRLSEKPF